MTSSSSVVPEVIRRAATTCSRITASRRYTEATEFFPFLGKTRSVDGSANRHTMLVSRELVASHARSRRLREADGHAMSSPLENLRAYTHVPGPLLDYIQHLCSATAIIQSPTRPGCP